RGGVACWVSDGCGNRDGGAGGRCIETDINAVIEHGLGDRAAEQFVTILVGDSDSVTYRGASAERDGGIDLTVELRFIDEAVVVSVFGDFNTWRGGCAGATAVIKCCTV
ncbi:hypothetical protein HWQ46_27040, partial [Shewanella sp. D64]